jgi:phage terminase small subunit
MADLTPKQEAFACKYVECGNASEAYRHAYDAGEMGDQAVWNEASRLTQHPQVAIRVKELRDAIAEAAKLTVTDLLRELEEARTAALTAETVQASAAAAATMGKAKLLGLDKQALTISGPDGGPVQQAITVTFHDGNAG